MEKWSEETWQIFGHVISAGNIECTNSKYTKLGKAYVSINTVDLKN